MVKSSTFWTRTAVLAGSAALVVSLGAAAPRTMPQGAVTDHVVIVSLDGLRPDAIEKYGARNLQRLMREGAYSLKAQTIFPSKTLPSHTSMLTGVPPAVHGITWNEDETDKHGVVSVPTVFEIAHEKGFTTAAFFSKPKFHHLEREGSLDHTQAPNGEKLTAARTVGDAITYLRHRQPSLMFVHIGEADYAGHTMGWMSTVYGWAVKRADAAVGELLEAADRAYGEGNYTVIVTADHGGHGRNHGTDDPRDMTIPWIVWGEGVGGGEINGAVKTMDTAATALWLLGVAAPPTWTGSAVAGAFTSGAQLAAVEATADEATTALGTF